MLVTLIVVRLKKAFQKLDRAVFIFQLLIEVKVNKDYNNTVWRFKYIVGFFYQWASTAFRFLMASLLAIALALQTKIKASYLLIPMQLGYLASQVSFILYFYIYIFYILSSSSVIKTLESIFFNLLRLSLSLRLFILPTVIIYSSSSIAVQSRVRLVGGQDKEALDIGLLSL